jgi:hypothetical protein
MFCMTDNIMQNIHHIQFECEEYYVELTNIIQNISRIQFECENILQKIIRILLWLWIMLWDWEEW